MLYEKITKLRMDAMKAKDKVKLSTLTTLKGDIDRRRINMNDAVTDEVVLATIKATLKSLKEMIDEKVKHGMDAAGEQAEYAYLEQFMPQALSEVEIKAHIQDAVAIHGDSKASMGKIMGHLKGIEGMDMAVAKPLVQNILQ